MHSDPIETNLREQQEQWQQQPKGHQSVGIGKRKRTCFCSAQVVVSIRARLEIKSLTLFIDCFKRVSTERGFL